MNVFCKCDVCGCGEYRPMQIVVRKPKITVETGPCENCGMDSRQAEVCDQKEVKNLDIV
jgi:hypothetical protein